MPHHALMGVMGVPPDHVTHCEHDEKQGTDGENAFFDFHPNKLAQPRAYTMGSIPMPTTGRAPGVGFRRQTRSPQKTQQRTLHWTQPRTGCAAHRRGVSPG